MTRISQNKYYSSNFILVKNRQDIVKKSADFSLLQTLDCKSNFQIKKEICHVM